MKKEVFKGDLKRRRKRQRGRREIALRRKEGRKKWRMEGRKE